MQIYVAHDLKLNNGSDLKDEKPTIFCVQKGPKMSKTFAPPPSCCCSPFLRDTKQRGGEVLVTKQMMKIYGTMGNLWKLSIIH